MNNSIYIIFLFIISCSQSKKNDLITVDKNKNLNESNRYIEKAFDSCNFDSVLGKVDLAKIKMDSLNIMTSGIVPKSELKFYKKVPSDTVYYQYNFVSGLNNKFKKSIVVIKKSLDKKNEYYALPSKIESFETNFSNNFLCDNFFDSFNVDEILSKYNNVELIEQKEDYIVFIQKGIVLEFFLNNDKKLGSIRYRIANDFDQ